MIARALSIMIGVCCVDAARGESRAQVPRDGVAEAKTIFAICKARDAAGWSAEKLAPCYKEALALDPTSIEAMWTSGLNAWERRAYDEANALWRVVLSKGPAKANKRRLAELGERGWTSERGCEDCELWHVLRALRRSLATGEIGGAFKLGSDAAARWPTRWEPLVEIASICASAGDVTNAIALLHEARGYAVGDEAARIDALGAEVERRDRVATARAKWEELEGRGDAAGASVIARDLWDSGTAGADEGVALVRLTALAGARQEAQRLASEVKRRFRSPELGPRLALALKGGSL